MHTLVCSKVLLGKNRNKSKEHSINLNTSNVINCKEIKLMKCRMQSKPGTWTQTAQALANQDLDQNFLSRAHLSLKLISQGFKKEEATEASVAYSGIWSNKSISMKCSQIKKMLSRERRQCDHSEDRSIKKKSLKWTQLNNISKLKNVGND